MNNAAVGLPPSRTEIIAAWPKIKLGPTEHTRKDFEEVFAVNTFGIVETISERTLPITVTSVAVSFPSPSPSPRIPLPVGEKALVNDIMVVYDALDAFAQLLSKSSSPRIVNVSSGAGSLGCMSWFPADDNGAGSIVYNASYVSPLT